MTDRSQIMENLNTVDWGSYDHAYGPASDTPGILKKIMFSDDEEEIRKLTSTLRNTINHQDDIYEVTILTIPFYIDMLRCEEIKGRHYIAELLECIIGGVPTEYYQLVVAPHLFPKPNNPNVSYVEKRTEMVARSYEIIREHYPLYTALLKSEDSKLRGEIGMLLCYFHEYAEQTYHTLISALEVETKAETAIDLLNLFPSLLDNYLKDVELSGKERVFALFADRKRHPQVRLDTLSVYVRLDNQFHPEIEKFLFEVFVSPLSANIEYEQEVKALNDQDKIQDLARVKTSHVHLKVVKILEILDLNLGSDYFDLFYPVIRYRGSEESLAPCINYTFFNKVVDPNDLSLQQKIVLGFLLNVGIFWRNKEAQELLHSYGIPVNQSDMKRLVLKHS